MTTHNASPEVCYVGYSALELAVQRQAMREALSELRQLARKWQARAAREKREADRVKLEQAVTQMAASLSSKSPIAPGRELPFPLSRRVVRATSEPATVKLQSGIRRKSLSLFMSQVAYCA